MLLSASQSIILHYIHRHTLNQGPLRLAAESSVAPDGGEGLIHCDDIMYITH